MGIGFLVLALALFLIAIVLIFHKRHFAESSPEVYGARVVWGVICFMFGAVFFTEWTTGWF